MMAADARGLRLLVAAEVIDRFCPGHDVSAECDGWHVGDSVSWPENGEAAAVIGWAVRCGAAERASVRVWLTSQWPEVALLFCAGGTASVIVGPEPQLRALVNDLLANTATACAGGVVACA